MNSILYIAIFCLILVSAFFSAGEIAFTSVNARRLRSRLEEKKTFALKTAVNIIDNYDKEIIIATHVLDSMKNGLNGTINEMESIYSFINNGVTGFLLAGETSIGKYPVQTAKLLKELIKKYKKY